MEGISWSLGNGKGYGLGIKYRVLNIINIIKYNAVVPEDISSSSESVRVLPRQRHLSKLGELHGSPDSPRPTLVLKLK